MNRRTVLAGTGLALGTATAGCLGMLQSEEEKRRAAACSHLPDDATSPEYETAVLSHPRDSLLADGTFRRSASNEDGTPFAYVRSADDVETKLRLDTLEEDDDDHASIRTFVEETDFDTAVLLVWQTSTPSRGYQIDIVGVDQPDGDSIHAYTCMYHDGGANGTAVTPYLFLIRVDAAPQPRRAKLHYRRGVASGERREETTYEEITYEDPEDP